MTKSTPQCSTSHVNKSLTSSGFRRGSHGARPRSLKYYKSSKKIYVTPSLNPKSLAASAPVTYTNSDINTTANTNTATFKNNIPISRSLIVFLNKLQFSLSSNCLLLDLDHFHLHCHTIYLHHACQWSSCFYPN